MLRELSRWYEQNRIKPVQAGLAISRLLRDPDDTSQVFKVLEALRGDSLSRALRRMRSDERGQTLLAEQPNIVNALNDREARLSIIQCIDDIWLLCEQCLTSLITPHAAKCSAQRVTSKGLEHLEYLTRVIRISKQTRNSQTGLNRFNAILFVPSGKFAQHKMLCLGESSLGGG